jgi:apolipoprotein N-acyltransferase
MFALVGLFIARTNLARQKEDPTRGPFSIPIWQIAALYTVTEFLYPMIFPWYLANGQYRFLPAIQIAELGGVMSITFMMVAFNAALHRFLARRLHGDPLPRRAMIIALLGTAAVLVYGQIRIAMVDAQIADAPKVKLGLVEADIGIFEKQAKHLEPSRQRYTRHRNLLKHQWMSAELERQGVDLVVWPESSYFPVGEPFMKRKDDMALALGADGTLSVWRFQAKDAGVKTTPADFCVPRHHTRPSCVRSRSTRCTRGPGRRSPRPRSRARSPVRRALRRCRPGRGRCRWCMRWAPGRPTTRRGRWPGWSASAA